MASIRLMVRLSETTKQNKTKLSFREERKNEDKRGQQVYRHWANRRNEQTHSFES